MSLLKGSSRRAGRRREAVETWGGGVERGQRTHHPLEFLSMMGGRMAPTVSLITPIVPAVSSIRGSVKPTRSLLWLVYPPHLGGILALRSSVESPPVLGGVILHFPPFPSLIWASVKPTCCPLSNLFTPHQEGYSGIIEGGQYATHTPPSFWFIPMLGDSFFSQQFIEGGPV